MGQVLHDARIDFRAYLHGSGLLQCCSCKPALTFITVVGETPAIPATWRNDMRAPSGVLRIRSTSARRLLAVFRMNGGGEAASGLSLLPISGESITWGFPTFWVSKVARFLASPTFPSGWPEIPGQGEYPQRQDLAFGSFPQHAAVPDPAGWQHCHCKCPDWLPESGGG